MLISSGTYFNSIQSGFISQHLVSVFDFDLKFSNVTPGLGPCRSGQASAALSGFSRSDWTILATARHTPDICSGPGDSKFCQIIYLYF